MDNFNRYLLRAVGAVGTVGAFVGSLAGAAVGGCLGSVAAFLSSLFSD